MRRRLRRFALAVYRASLRVYPREFRELYAGAMVRAAADSWDDRVRRSGLQAAARSSLVLLADALFHGVLEHLSPADPEPIFDPPEHTPGGPMEALFRDLRYAVRGLVRRPAFALTATVTLALALGFNTMLFSVVRGVLLDPLPYTDSDELVVLQSSHVERGIEGVSVLDYLDWSQRATLFEEMAAYQYWGYSFAADDTPVELVSIQATPSLFPLLGVEPALGRGFTDREGVLGHHRVVVISHDLWQSRFGGSPAVLGRVVDLDAEPHEIVGVMPPGFEFPADHPTQVWGALAFDLDDRRRHGNRHARNFAAVARLKDGVGLEEARRELDHLAAGLAAAHPDSNTGWTIRAERAHDVLVGGVRTTLLVLFGAVGLLLLIACANLANLTLARLLARQREIAVRTGLGAARRHLVRQFLAESLLLSLLGGFAGLGLAALGIRWIRGFSLEVLPRVRQVELDAGVAAFTVALCGATALLFGLVPALRASASSVAEHLRTHSVRPLASRRLFGSLVVCQVALALVLSIGAGLMARSFVALTRVDPGFVADNVLAANVFLPRSTYTRPDQKRAFFDRMLEELTVSPGVVSVGAVTALPLDEVGINFDLPFEVDGQPPAREGEAPQADFRVATPGYFETAGIRLVRGRIFEERDRDGAPRVMLINQTMARRWFGDDEAVGRFVTIAMGGRHEVIGVVADLKHYGLASETRPEMYVAFDQTPFGGMTVVIRTAGDPDRYTSVMQRAAQAADPNQAIYQQATLSSLLDEVLFLPRLQMVILGLFAACSCLLAAIGLYGVMSSMVAQRAREFGIRLALGAGTDDVMWMVVGRGMRLAAVGIVAGLVASLGLTRLIESLLFEVRPLDASVLAAACAGFGAVVLVANLVPAWRAMRVNPVETLAAE